MTQACSRSETTIPRERYSLQGVPTVYRPSKWAEDQEAGAVGATGQWPVAYALVMDCAEVAAALLCNVNQRPVCTCPRSEFNRTEFSVRSEHLEEDCEVKSTSWAGGNLIGSWCQKRPRG